MLVSACLIVRDEERSLRQCLAALMGVVDEMVVHDTGSRDCTVAVARAAGARVIEGKWADDFAAARNTALARCRGEWVLHVDADEILNCHAGDLRAWLAATAVDAALVDIENLMDDGTGHSYVHKAVRLFRRERAHWHGRIHEQVVARLGQPPLLPPESGAPARIVHHGYLHHAMAAKDKVARNLRLVEVAIAGGDRSPELLLDLGRSLKAAGRLEEACAAFAESATPTAFEFLASCRLGLGDIDAAAAAIAQLPEGPMAEFLQGQLRLQQGDAGGALERFDALGELVDATGRRAGAAVLPVHRATALGLLQRWPEAADQWAEAVGNRGGVSGNVTALIEAYTKAGRSMAALAAVLQQQADAVLDELAKLPPAEAELVTRALWNTAAPDPRLDEAITAAAENTPPNQFIDALLRLDAHAPAALPLFIEAAATTGERCVALADALDRLGANEPAAAIRQHAEVFSREVLMPLGPPPIETSVAGNSGEPASQVSTD